MSGFTTNPQAMHETIDGETIVIDLSTGTYYSLRGSGPTIWNAIASGASREAIIDDLENAYEATPGEIAKATDTFLSELEAEQLIAKGNGAGPSAGSTPAPTETRSAFEAPQLEKYEDMQDIILLDPVHMVDDQGWPHPAPAAGTNRHRGAPTSACPALPRRCSTPIPTSASPRSSPRRRKGRTRRAALHDRRAARSRCGSQASRCSRGWADPSSTSRRTPWRPGADGQPLGLGFDRHRAAALSRGADRPRRDRADVLLRAGRGSGDGPLADALRSGFASCRGMVLDAGPDGDGVLGLGGAAPGDPALVARLPRRHAGARGRGRHRRGRSARRRSRRLGEVDHRPVVTRRRSSLRRGRLRRDDAAAGALGAQPRIAQASSMRDTSSASRALPAAVANPVREEDEKAIVYVDRAFPGSPIGGFPLRAVLVPRVVARSRRRASSPPPLRQRWPRSRPARSSSSIRRRRTHSPRWPRSSARSRASRSSWARTSTGSRKRSSDWSRLRG